MKKRFQIRDAAYADPEVVQLSKEIRDAQARLRALLSDEAWTAYLEVELLSNARLLAVEDALLEAVRTVEDDRDEGP